MIKLNLDGSKIRELYLDDGKTIIHIAKIMKVNKQTIRRRLESLGIKRSIRIDLDEDKIRELYLNQGKFMKEIAKVFGVSRNTIFRRLKQKNAMRKENNPLNLSKIKNLYVNQEKSVTEIAKILNVSTHPIYDRLKEMGIERRRKFILDNNKIRELYINERKLTTEIAKIMNVGHQTINRRLKEMGIKRQREKNLDEIKDLYLNKKKTPTEIGKIFGLSNTTILSRLKEKGVGIRDGSESKGKKGEAHPNFNNWSSREPYGKEFSPELKEQIRIRDNHTCQECGKIQKELKRKLDVHHIDYNKQNNSPSNLISLSIKCHRKTNYNRKHWTNYFKMRMFMKTLFDPRNILIFNENKQLIGVDMIE